MTTPNTTEPAPQFPNSPAADHSPADDLLTVSEVSSRLRVDDSTVRRWATRGALEVVVLPHIGKRRTIRVRRQVLDDLINSSSTWGVK